MKIKDIFYNTDLISVRTYNICCENGFETVADIYKYKRVHLDFFRLRKCGAKTNLELNDLILKYNESADQKSSILEQFNNLTIDDVFAENLINTSTLNFCKTNNFYSLIDLIEYYKNENSYLNFKNCTVNINTELIDLCESFMSKFNNGITNEKLNYNYLILNFNRLQREVLNNFISIAFNKFSPRSKNALNVFLNNDISIINLSSKILSTHDFDFKRIQNVGTKSIVELDQFLYSLKTFINSLSEIKTEDEISKLVYKYILKNLFINIEIPDDILSTKSLLKILEFLILNNAIYNTDFENFILKYGINIFNNKNILTADEISSKLKITKERVRQIREKIANELFDYFSFVQTISKNVDFFFRIDPQANFININDEIVSKINKDNNTVFSKTFITLLIHINYKDHYSRIGVMEDSLYYRGFTPKNRHTWSCFYLIKTSILSYFKFDEFFHNIYYRKNLRIKETYSKNIKSYISNFLVNVDYKLISELFSTIEYILFNEFGLLIDLNDNIVFEKNTYKLKHEYIIEALEILNKPSRINEIFDLLNRKYPDVISSIDSIRGSAIKQPEIIYFGKKSTYGLKKWESLENQIVGGTIKDNVLNYLNTKNEPIHICEILEQLTNYRFETNAKNVITNLKLDPYKQFVFFNQSFIGLKSKIYNSTLTNLPMQLGKKIVLYINANKDVDFDIVVAYFSRKLSISESNMIYIIRQLIENRYIINTNNKLNKL